MLDIRVVKRPVGSCWYSVPPRWIDPSSAYRQANTRLMILGVPELVELASSFYTLYPGDLVFSGTPEGVGPIAPGDRIVAAVEGIGTIEVDVRAAEHPPRTD